LPSDMNPLKQADKVMPYFYAHQLPVGLGGLVLASFLCDAMQTLVSGVNSISAIATKDVMDRLYPEGMKRILLEVAARHHLLKRRGYHAARELAGRISDALGRKG